MASARFTATKPDPEAMRADRTIRVADEPPIKSKEANALMRRIGLKDDVIQFVKAHKNCCAREVAEALNTTTEYVNATARRSNLTLRRESTNPENPHIRVTTPVRKALEVFTRDKTSSVGRLANRLLEEAVRRGLHNELFDAR